MRDNPVPWIGLAAVLAMFIIPFLPDWLFEGPRTAKHWPRRHVCGGCGAAWTEEHTCKPDASGSYHSPLRGELRRAKQPDFSPRTLTRRKGTIARSRARGD
jgi:hypothetical protein